MFSRIFFITVYVLTLQQASPRNVVFFHNTNVPSNLYVNAAHGPTHIIDNSPDQTDIIRLLLYPTDKTSRSTKEATVVFTSGDAKGTLLLRQANPPLGTTVITGTITGLTPGEHGLSIHTLGDLKNGCTNIGDVYNPYMLSVDWQPFNRFLGDLGFIEADETGTASVLIADPFVSLVGPRAVVGRALAIRDHEGPSDNVLQEVTHVASSCGVIGYAN